jgi:cytoskeletal protein RodZ
MRISVLLFHPLFIFMTEKQETSSEETPKNNPSSSRASRGPLLGLILFGIIVLLVVGVVIMMAWGGYRGYRLSQERAALPSIATLSVGETAPETVDKPQEATVEEKPSADAVALEESAKKAKATAIKVLNGGAAKGSASVLAEVLKKEGYTQVTTGNTIKDYTGVAVYFSPEVEKEAAVVKNDLLATYPKAEAKPAVKTNTETTQAPLSIIIGK